MNPLNENGSGGGCLDFRDKLARALEGRPLPAQLTTLAWHEHLIACTACRDLLEHEEALEVLLATLPEPNLPPDLTRRLVARLSPANAQPVAMGLDELLDVAGAPVPAGLGARVRAGLRAELALDGLLELDRGVEIPAGLSAQVLRGLAAERHVPRLRLLRSVPAYAAAAGVLLTALGLSLWSGALDPAGTESPERIDEEVAVVTPKAPTEDSSEPDPSLLAVLDLIENDGLWQDTQDGAEIAAEEVDLHLLLSDSLGTSDELLLTYIEDDEAGGEGPSGG